DNNSWFNDSNLDDYNFKQIPRINHLNDEIGSCGVNRYIYFQLVDRVQELSTRLQTLTNSLKVELPKCESRKKLLEKQLGEIVNVTEQKKLVEKLEEITKIRDDLSYQQVIFKDISEAISVFSQVLEGMEMDDD